MSNQLLIMKLTEFPRKFSFVKVGERLTAIFYVKILTRVAEQRKVAMFLALKDCVLLLSLWNRQSIRMNSTGEGAILRKFRLNFYGVHNANAMAQLTVAAKML